jgi:hypothetical protein
LYAAGWRVNGNLPGAIATDRPGSSWRKRRPKQIDSDLRRN